MAAKHPRAPAAELPSASSHQIRLLARQRSSRPCSRPRPWSRTSRWAAVTGERAGLPRRRYRDILRERHDLAARGDRERRAHRRLRRASVGRWRPQRRGRGTCGSGRRGWPRPCGSGALEGHRRESEGEDGGILVIFAGWAHMSGHLNGVNWMEVNGRVHRYCKKRRRVHR